MKENFHKDHQKRSEKEKNKEDRLFNKIKELENNLYREEQDMLKFAVELRSAMWS